MLRYNRRMWAGHADRRHSWTKRCQSLEVDVRRGKGKPRKSSDDAIAEDLRTCHFNIEGAEDRDDWRQQLHTASTCSQVQH